MLRQSSRTCLKVLQFSLLLMCYVMNTYLSAMGTICPLLLLMRANKAIILSTFVGKRKHDRSFLFIYNNQWIILIYVLYAQYTRTHTCICKHTTYAHMYMHIHIYTLQLHIPTFKFIHIMYTHTST